MLDRRERGVERESRNTVWKWKWMYEGMEWADMGRDVLAWHDNIVHVVDLEGSGSGRA